jgi:hypothetical protein
MNKLWEVTWEGELPAAPQAVWDTITKHADGYLWPIEYEPWVGGAERGLTEGGGVVTEWEPERRFATRTRPEHERDGLNEIVFDLEPLGEITYARYTHRAEIPEAEYDVQLAMCRAHTTFYLHSLGQHACYFTGQGAAYASADVEGSFADVLRRLGVPDGAVAGDRVTVTPDDGEPIDGVIDYHSASMFGVRGTDVLFRVYGRDTWGWPVGVSSHRFANGSEA